MEINKILIKKLIESGVKTPEDLALAKRKIAKKYKISCPKNVSLLKIYHKLVENKTLLRQSFRGQKNKKTLINLEKLLRTRPIRSLSGIVNISVLTKPYPCPGNCVFCPQESGIPKSYVSGEPAVERAKTLKYNPYLQVKKRIETLKNQGHPTDKIELRIIGGTWSYYPNRYQTWFIKRCFQACNNQSRQNKTMVSILRDNEKAKHRIVGLSIETRPDFITPTEIKHLRNLGVTMVELGIQSIDDEVLRINKRGHGVKKIIKATKLLKDAGFKVLYQMMLNLPGSDPKKDLEMFKELFSNPDFQPDLLKIYPCALLKGTLLFKWWEKGKYKPYTDQQLINLIKKIKKFIPYYVRIQRITRDIPSHSIVEGPAKISNLRQILAEKSRKEGWKCNCIRCREIKEDYNPKEKLYLFREDYSASGGKEIFLSYENKNRTKLYSLLRLRLTSQNTAIIRDLHTYGQQLPLACRRRTSVRSPQHKGLGKKLIKEAEKIAKKEFNANKIAVISGIGVRDYYRKLNYKLENTYMMKVLL